MNPKRNIVTLALISIFLISCNPIYLRVDISVNTAMLKKEPEITESKTYYKVRESIKNVVISLPPEFYGVMNISDPQDTLTTQGAIKADYEMGITEIEKLLIEKGMTVLSRQKFEEVAQERKTRNVSEAASLIGADVIIQINSLDYSNLVPIQKITDINMKFYNSNKRGDKKKKASIDEKSKNQIVEDVMSSLGESKYFMAYLGFIDCKVIYAKTGEIIWFYRNRIYLPLSSEKSQAQGMFLFEGDARGRQEWTLINPEVPFDRSKKKNKRSYSEITLRETSPVLDEIERQIKEQIVRLMCTDFVNKFLGQK